MRHALAALLVLLSVVPCFAGKRYSYYRVGSPDDVTRQVAGGLVLMGGSTDVDEAFTWMCDRGGNGDFLVVRASGTDAYNPYIAGLCPEANSVATLIVPSVTAADDPFVAAAIEQAEAVFLAGGDQSDYVLFWGGTGLQAALQAAIARKAPVGGTSAGMMVLTQFIYSAEASLGVTSSEALADPFNKYVTLARDLVTIPLLANALGDSHFAARDRMGRDLAFLCRVAANGWSPAPRGISVDERTVLLVEPDGSTRVAGESAAYFLAAPGPAEVCAPGTPLTYRGVAVQKVATGGTFSLARWAGRRVTRYAVTAEAGVLSSTQRGGSIY